MIETRFNPADDITAKELADILGHLLTTLKHPIVFTEAQWGDLEFEMKRHFLRHT